MVIKGTEMIYLDYAANYPVKDEVLKKLIDVEKKYYGNTNSFHKVGEESLKKYQEENLKALRLLNLDPSEYEIVYTSSASESNNLAIKGIYNSYQGFGKHILTSPFEHSSVSATLGFLKESGAEVELLKANSDGKIDLIDLKNKLRNDTILLTMILIESETGIIEPYKEVIDVLKDYPNCHLLIDATQAMCKLPLDYNGIEMFSFAPHKFGGIIGSGFLVKKKSTILTPLIHGGKSVSIYRSSTCPLGLISSSIKALELGLNDLNKNYAYVKSLNDYLIDNLKDIKEIEFNSKDNSPYILNISIKNKKAGETVKYLSDHNICVSQKSACSIKNTSSSTIMNIYHDKNRALSSFRISLSSLTTKEELDEFIKVLRSYINE